MPRYVLAYFGGDQPSSPEQGRAHFEKYQAWLAGLGDAVVSPMNPFRTSNTIKADGSVSEGSATAMSGYTVLQANAMQDALAMVRDCPFLELNGTLELSELHEMGG